MEVQEAPSLAAMKIVDGFVGCKKDAIVFCTRVMVKRILEFHANTPVVRIERETGGLFMIRR